MKTEIFEKEIAAAQDMKQAVQGDLMTTITGWRKGERVVTASIPPNRDNMVMIANGFRVCFSVDTVSWCCEAYQKASDAPPDDDGEGPHSLQYAMETGEGNEGILETVQVLAASKIDGHFRVEFASRPYLMKEHQTFWLEEEDTDLDTDGDNEYELLGGIVQVMTAIFASDQTLQAEMLEKAPAALVMGMTEEVKVAHMDYVGQQHLGELMIKNEIQGALMLFADPGSDREKVLERSSHRDDEEEKKRFPSNTGMVKVRKWGKDG